MVRIQVCVCVCRKRRRCSNTKAFCFKQTDSSRYTAPLVVGHAYKRDSPPLGTDAFVQLGPTTTLSPRRVFLHHENNTFVPALIKKSLDPFPTEIVIRNMRKKETEYISLMRFSTLFLFFFLFRQIITLDYLMYFIYSVLNVTCIT